MAHLDKQVVVLGGGVIGLQSAIFLLEAGYKVKLVAEYLPQDRSVNYTSPWAGAIWAPHAGLDDLQIRQWDTDSYNFWDKMCENREEAKRAGVHRCLLYSYWDNPEENLKVEGVDAFWYSKLTSLFAILPATKLPEGVKYGTRFTAFCLNTPVYLQYLQDRITSLGGQIVQARLPTDKGLIGALTAATENKGLGEVHAFVNALGMGSKTILGDDAMFPTRGQTIYVKGEVEDVIVRTSDTSLAYLIPRKGSGYTLLGGSQEAGNWNGEVDADLSASILKNCAILAPELLDDKGNFQIISQQVGLRPSRTGGLRLELEVVSVEGQKAANVVHCYGHGGGGFEKSIGTGRKVIRLVDSIAD